MRKQACVALFALVAACHHDPTPAAAAAASPRGVATTAAPDAHPPAPPPGRIDALLARLHAADARVVAPDPSLPDVKHQDGAHLTAGQIDFPLTRTRVLARVTGDVARVEVTQVYQNPTTSRLEAVYRFPLPENAAVTDMMFRIGKRVVVSEVQKRDEARRTYERAKAEGHTAALTEQERPNLFTQSVANIPPGETVEVVLRYVHEVKYDSGRYTFVFPTTIGPRYKPASVSDGARISPPVVAPGVHSANALDLVVELGPAGAFRDVGSRSHRLRTAVDGGTRLIGLDDGDRLPDKDFILSWRPAGVEPDARVLTERDHGDDYLMMFVQPPADVAPDEVRPKELVFLIDKSGSMMGEPIETAKRVIEKALEQLGPDDTFQLVAFDSTTESMTPRALPNTRDNVAAAERWLSSLQGGGGTEMLSGITTALDLPADPKRLRMVVFCTDGFIGNEREIIEHIDKSRGATRVFGFGIGSSVNRYLIEGVARAGRGAAEIVRQGEPVDEAVARLYRRLDRPVLTDVTLAFDGVTVRALEPSRLPDLFAGQPLVVVGKYRGAAPGAKVTLTGKLGTRPFSRTLPLTVAAGDGRDAVLGTLWARRRIAELDDFADAAPDADAKGEIVGLALKFKLVTAYTSFVAVEKELKVDTRAPLAELLVPNELPEGVAYRGIFGDGLAAAQVTPARVKPGDPEIRVQAPARAAVHVTLPWTKRPIRAVWDARAGEHVARFLVPAGWPDGSWIGRVRIDEPGGVREERLVELHVDTRPAAIAVLSSPATVHPGEAMALALKPALPLGTLAEAIAADREGGVGDALKSAMDVKELLVRAPWGEVVRARLDGPLGLYTATLHVPRDVRAGAGELEIVAADTAGNVSRRAVAFTVESRSPASWGLGALVALALGGVAVRRRANLRGGLVRRRVGGAHGRGRA